jgi:hypothetical protein
MGLHGISMADKLVTIANCLSPEEAGLVQGYLEEQGIRTYCSGTASANTLSYLGWWNTGAQLHVAERDSERAASLLEQVQREKNAASLPAWRCPACGADVDAGFERCWSCGSEPVDSAAIEAEVHQQDRMDSADAAASSESADDTVLRAWRCALLGLAFFPLELYALYLLTSVGDSDLSVASTWKYYGAILVSVVNLSGWVTFALYM